MAGNLSGDGNEVFSTSESLDNAMPAKRHVIVAATIDLTVLLAFVFGPSLFGFAQLFQLFQFEQVTVILVSPGGSLGGDQAIE